MSGFFDRERFARDHRWAPGRMSEYLDGDLASSARARMERHIGDCEECRRLLDGLRRTLDGLHRLSGSRERVDGRKLAAAVRVRLNEPPAS